MLIKVWTNYQRGRRRFRPSGLQRDERRRRDEVRAQAASEPAAVMSIQCRSSPSINARMILGAVEPLPFFRGYWWPLYEMNDLAVETARPRLGPRFGVTGGPARVG